MNMEEEEEIPIPGDVCALEILTNVPASDLQKFKSVCKKWRQLITSPYFVRLHLSRSIRTQARLLMTFPFAIVEHNHRYKQTNQIPYPPQFCATQTKIVGSADGLVCLLDQKLQQRFTYDGSDTPAIAAVLNPSTGKYLHAQLLSLPDHNSYIILCSWFGNVDGEYVLVLGLLITLGEYECGVYKFTRNNSVSCVHSIPVALRVTIPLYFRPIQEIGTFDRIIEERGTFVGGVVYWPILLSDGQFGYSISAYHVHKNKHWEIPPPAQCDFRLGVVDERLVAVLKNNMTSVFELWIMKETWTKYANIEGFNNVRVLSPLGFLPNGDIILDVDKTRLMKYSFKDNEPTLFGEYGSIGDVGAIVCADSLVSPEIF